MYFHRRRRIKLEGYCTFAGQKARLPLIIFSIKHGQRTFRLSLQNPMVSYFIIFSLDIHLSISGGGWWWFSLRASLTTFTCPKKKTKTQQKNPHRFKAI